MTKKRVIESITARQILDSRGNPTVEAQVFLENSITCIASVPSGASTGQYEAHELRDHEKEYDGKSVKNAVTNVKEKISKYTEGMDVTFQKEFDLILCKKDGSEGKEKLGANAILAASMALAQTAAKSTNMPLYRYLGGVNACQLPVPMSNVLNGGAHADNDLDFQEFMIMPVGASNFSEALRMCTEVYHALKKLLKEDGHVTAVGDEGGFAPNIGNAFSVFTYLSKAVEKAGYEVGKDICFAMDCAASELYHEQEKKYYFPGESREKGKEIIRTSSEMIDLYEELLAQFPILSIEDGLDEEDWDGWVKMTERLGSKVQLVGDDLFVTNTKRLRKGISMKAANAILIKVNQIGSVTEAMEAIEMAHKAGYHAIVSHRSGETEDTFIADLAVAVNAGQIKTGAPCRSDRVAKYNRLLRIEEELGEAAVFENPFTND